MIWIALSTALLFYVLFSLFIWNLAMPVPACQKNKWKHFLLGFRWSIFYQNLSILTKCLYWCLKTLFWLILLPNLRLIRPPSEKEKGRFIKEWFTRSGSAFIKFAQLLSSRENCQDGLFHSDFLAELADLRENVRPHLTLEDCWAVIEKYDGIFFNYIKYLSPDPIGVGSSGQVHLAVFAFQGYEENDNKKFHKELVAIKFRNPQLTEEIAFSFSILNFWCLLCKLFAPFSKVCAFFTHPSFRATLQRFEHILHEQDDMVREVEKQNKALSGCLNRPGQPARVMTPISVIPSLINQEMFLMELLPLDSMQSVEKKMEQLRKNKTASAEDLAKGFVDVSISNVMEDRLLHSDLHAGNVKITTRSTNECPFQFIFLDWPICPELSDEEFENIRKYIASCVLKDPYQLAHSSIIGSNYLNPSNKRKTDEAILELCKKFCRKEFANWKVFQQEITQAMMGCSFFKSHLRDMVVFMQNFESNIATCLRTEENKDVEIDSMTFAMDYAKDSQSKNLSIVEQSFISKEEFEKQHGFC